MVFLCQTKGVSVTENLHIDMKNHITEEQALAVVKEGKEQGIKIIYLKITLS